jgi:hypothetical protein
MNWERWLIPVYLLLEKWRRTGSPVQTRPDEKFVRPPPQTIKEKLGILHTYNPSYMGAIGSKSLSNNNDGNNSNNLKQKVLENRLKW